MDNIFKMIFSGTTQHLIEEIEEGSDINAQDKDKRTPLIQATIDNQIDKMIILIRNGANVNIQDSLGYTALHYASQNFLIDACKLLLENKATVDIQDIHGNTPLFRAVFNSKGRGEIIGLLRSFGADINLNNRHGVSPLQLANTIGNFDIKQFMI